MINITELLFTDHIIEASKEDCLSKALAKLPSSHSAAFIFSKDKKNVALVNPYHCAIRNSLPGNAKVESCLFHPPKLYINTPVSKIIHAFISTKIHYLPVFNADDTFAGVISAKKILAAFRPFVFFNGSIGTVLKKRGKPLVTIREDEPIAIAIHLFKFYKISKLIVVNKDNKLKGILTYYDIIHYLLTPKHKMAVGQKEGKKDSFYNQKVSRFSKTFVLTLKPSDSMLQALDLVLDKKIGSVIVVDEQKHPVGIITTRDFMNLILQPKLGVQMQLFSKNLSQSSSEILQSFFKGFSFFLNKTPHLAKGKLSVQQEKGKRLFKVLFTAFSDRGEEQLIKREGRDLKLVLQDVKDGVRTSQSKLRQAKHYE